MDFFFSSLFKMKKQSEDLCAFQCILVWLTFSSFILVLPSLCTSLPRAGRRMTRRAYGHSRACKPKFQFCFEGWETIFYIIFLKKYTYCILVLYCVRAHLCSLMFVTVPCVCYCVLWAAQNVHVLWPFPRALSTPPHLPISHPPYCSALLGLGLARFKCFCVI
jgi:hypothetical protein